MSDVQDLAHRTLESSPQGVSCRGDQPLGNESRHIESSISKVRFAIETLVLILSDSDNDT